MQIVKKSLTFNLILTFKILILYKISQLNFHFFLSVSYYFPSKFSLPPLCQNFSSLSVCPKYPVPKISLNLYPLRYLKL